MTNKTTSAIDLVERATPEMLCLAEQAVNSSRALSVFAACEWDELGDDGKVWIAVIIDQAVVLTERLFADAIKPRLRGCFEPLSKDHFESWLDSVAVSLARAALAARKAGVKQAPAESCDEAADTITRLQAALERLIAVAENLAGELTDPGTEALAAIYCAKNDLRSSVGGE